MRLRFLFPLFFVLIGCSANDVDNDITIENTFSTVVSIHEQEFEIIPFYEPYLHYTTEIQNSKRTRGDVYFETVIEPLSKELNLHPNELLHLHSYFQTPNNTRRLQQRVQQLDELHPDILSYLEEAIEDVTNLLKGDLLKVYLLPVNPELNAVDVQGVGGFATDDGKAIVIMIDPDIYHEYSLKETFAHEYHHAIFIQRSDYKVRRQHLLDQVLMEGKAEFFTKMIYPDFIPPWIEEFTEEERVYVLDYLEEFAFSYNPEHVHTMLYGNGLLPKWSNYKIGFEIMQLFLAENPEVTVDEWTFMRADEIINKTNYAGTIGRRN